MFWSLSQHAKLGTAIGIGQISNTIFIPSRQTHRNEFQLGKAFR